MKFTITDITKEIEDAFKGIRDPIAEAATAAVHEAGGQLKSEGRANIAAAGFSKKWQNTWGVKFFPSRKESIDAVAYGRHKIPYSQIFESGGTITGRRGMLWLPIRSNVPKMGRGRATPRRLVQAGVKLFSMRSSSGKPLLATRVREGSANKSSLQFSLSKLRRGTAGKRGVVRAVPLFFGVPLVTIPKKFNLAGVARRAQESIAERYASHVAAGG